jgi:hypothetical protein
VARQRLPLQRVRSPALLALFLSQISWCEFFTDVHLSWKTEPKSTDPFAALLKMKK